MIRVLTLPESFTKQNFFDFVEQIKQGIENIFELTNFAFEIYYQDNKDNYLRIQANYGDESELLTRCQHVTTTIGANVDSQNNESQNRAKVGIKFWGGDEITTTKYGIIGTKIFKLFKVFFNENYPELGFEPDEIELSFETIKLDPVRP